MHKINKFKKKRNISSQRIKVRLAKYRFFRNLLKIDLHVTEVCMCLQSLDNFVLLV